MDLEVRMGSDPSFSSFYTRQDYACIKNYNFIIYWHFFFDQLLCTDIIMQGKICLLLTPLLDIFWICPYL